MEMNKISVNLPSLKRIFDTSAEQNIDTDFTLPDYYPEISKILKCIADINILTSQCSNNGVTVGGQVILTVLYSGKDNDLNSFTHIYPFSKNVSVDNVADGTPTVTTRVAYLNTKAVSPRKIEIHGSLALNIEVETMENMSALQSTDCDGIYCKSISKNIAVLMPRITKSIFVDDDITVPQNKPPIGKILRSEATVEITESKFLGGKIVEKGEVTITFVYCPQDGRRPIKMIDSKPFSQIIDIDIDDNEPKFEALASVEALELHPKTAMNGEVRAVSFEAKVCLAVLPFIEERISLITDAYSGKYSADVIYREKTVEEYCETVEERYVCKKAFDFGSDSLSDVFDVGCVVAFTAATDKYGNLNVRGEVTANILGVDSDTVPVFFERPMEFEYKYNVGRESDDFRTVSKVTVSAVNYNLSASGTVDISIELCIKAVVFAVSTVNCVTDIKVDTENHLSRDPETAVVLYYPENESVWEIAKKYKASPKYICDANGLDDVEEICDKALIIPNI